MLEYKNPPLLRSGGFGYVRTYFDSGGVGTAAYDKTRHNPPSQEDKGLANLCLRRALHAEEQ